MKQRSYWISAITLAVLLVGSACRAASLPQMVRGSGNVTTETRPVSGFDQVSVGGGMHLFITQGDAESLEIEAEDNLLQYIELKMQGSTLEVDINTQGGLGFQTTKPINVYVTMIDVRAANISGGGSLDSDAIKTDNFDLELSGGAGADIRQLEATRLTANLSGGSHADLVGKVDDVNLNMSGGGTWRAEDLECASATLEISGGGNATVWVTDTLDADLSGGSHVDYYGDPQVSENVSGGSKLNDRGEH